MAARRRLPKRPASIAPSSNDYTPKHASWVNQVECFFGIVQRQCLANGSFRSTEELRQAVLAFIDHWNREKAHPFRWTFTGYPLQTGVKLAEAA